VAIVGAATSIVPRAWQPNLSASSSTYGQILIAGGENVPNILASTELYDSISNTFASSPPSMTTTFDGSTITLLAAGPNAGQILIAGGGGTFAVNLYDPSFGTFATGPSLNSGHIGATATIIGVGPNTGKILVAAGLFTSNATDIYDPAGNTITAGPALNVGRYNHTATTLVSGPNAGKILLAGGTNAVALSSTELYDPVSNSFAPPAGTATMVQARTQQTATLLASGPNAGMVLMAGGGNTSATELYDPVGNSFAAGASMNVNRAGHIAAVLSSGPNAGKVLLAGGSGGGTSTELYDPAINTFASPADTAPMLEDRHALTATAISSGPNAGQILIAGGKTSGGTALASTELYDPVANSFSAGPDMNVPRGFAVAIELPPGPLPTPTITATPTVTTTPTGTATSTATRTVTPTRTATPTITATATATATVTATPTATSTPTATATVTVSATATPTAVPEHLTVSPKSHNFGSITTGSQSKPVKIRISNTGQNNSNRKLKLPVLIEMVEGAANFPITSNLCPSPPGDLEFKQSCVVMVVCQGPAKGVSAKATMLIADNAIGTPQQVTLTCKGK